MHWVTWAGSTSVNCPLEKQCKASGWICLVLASASAHCRARANPPDYTSRTERSASSADQKFLNWVSSTSSSSFLLVVEPEVELLRITRRHKFKERLEKTGQDREVQSGVGMCPSPSMAMAAPEAW